MRKKLLLFAIFSLGFAITSQAQFAPTDDFDADGIINSIDIDDDNDGVPDSQESICGTLPLKSTMTVTSDIATGGGSIANVIDGTNTNNYWFANNATCVNKNLLEFTFPQAVNLTEIEVALNVSTSFLRNTVTYRVEGWDGTSYVDLTGTLASSGTASATTTAGNTLSVIFGLASNTGSYTKYRIYGLSGTTNNACYLREAFFTGCVATVMNTDGDGVVNQFDLDSDGDGCSDAFEAGATASTTANFQFPISGVGSNGLSNSLETVADNGILNYSSTYTNYGLVNTHNHCNLYATASGKVFMDFDGNSLQSSHLQEPGVKNVTVRAYKQDGTYADATTDSLGNYEFVAGQLAGGLKVRLEFINLPSGFHDGFKGSGSNTTVQFVTTSANLSNANLALSLPGHFSSTTDPYFAVVNFKRNTEATTLATITFMDTNKARIFVPTNTSDASNAWAKPNGASVSTFPIPTKFDAATTAQVGTTLGLAFDKHNKKLMTGSFMRGWSKMGINSSANGYGEAVIYQIPINGTSVSTPSVWLDLETLLGNDIAGTYLVDANHGGNGAFGKTNANPNKIGYTGLGMMKYSADGSQLYVVNLNKLEVMVIPIGAGGIAPTLASDIKRFPLPSIESPGSWANGNPYRSVLGLGVHPVTGRVYATLTCNGPAVTNLKGVVYSFDPNDNTPDSTDFVKELEVPLNINRPSTNPNVSIWYKEINHAWENVTANTIFYSNAGNNNDQHTQPWLGEIVFDALPDGSFGMTIAERNRYHDMLDGAWYITGGGLYRATNNGTAWSLENAGIAGPLTSVVNWSTSPTPVTTAGANSSLTNRFYKSVGHEGTFGYGSVEHVPGSNEVYMPTGDNVFNSGTSGIAWLSTLNGDRTRDSRLLSNFTTAGYNAVPFNKASNWGDIEMLGDLPTIEIGNLVWQDIDMDGIQDPNEVGMPSIVLNLYRNNILVGTTTTDANGNYYFTNANVTLNGATGILPNTAYEIRVNNGTALILTGTNTDNTANGDARDNDASGTTTAVIALTTGDYGENNHTYDIGFNCGPLSPVTASVYTQATCPAIGFVANNTASFQISTAGIRVSISSISASTNDYTTASTVTSGSAMVSNLNGNASTFYVRVYNSEACYLDTILNVTPVVCCPTVVSTAPVDYAKYCSSAIMPTFDVTTNAGSPDSIRLVYLNSPSSNANFIYANGILMAQKVITGTATTFTNTANFTNIALPANTSSMNDTIYVYAILIDDLGSTTCKVYGEKPVILLPKLATVNGVHSICNATPMTLTAGVSTSYKWGIYPASTVLATTQTYTVTPPSNTTTTYWLQTVSLDGCLSDTTQFAVTAGSGISGIAFRDINSNGVINNYETAGFENIKVYLYSNTGTILDSTTTDGLGNYAFPTATAALGLVRVEFRKSTFPAFTQESFAGTNNGTDVQFVTAPNCSVNLGLKYKGDYCQTNPKIATKIFVNGISTNTNNQDGMLSFNYTASGSSTPAGYESEATKAQTGAIWGMAYNKTQKLIYSASFLKRHVGLAGGLGDIYVSTKGAPSDASLFISIPNAGTIPNDATRGLGAPSGQSIDADAYGKVGRVGLGGIDISDNDSTLYVVNLFDKKMYIVDIATQTISNSVAIPSVCNANTGIMNPFALKVHNGKVFVGSVCDASVSTLRSDLQANVFEYNITTNSFNTTPVLSFPLDYTKGVAWDNSTVGVAGQSMTTHSNKWYPWLDVYNRTTLNAFSDSRDVICHPTPMLSDIEFDENDGMLVAFMDRIGHQFGESNRLPNNSKNEGAIVGGELLKASKIASNSWTIENTISSGGEFFTGELYAPGHYETSDGGLAYSLGNKDVVLSVMDPLAYTSGGIIHLSNTTGAQSMTGLQLYNSTSPNFFGKACGMGDVELLCDAAPLQIGNYVWFDANQDGIQDPNETPLTNVTITLWKGGNQLATTITDTKGEYYFSNKNASGVSWTGTGADTSLLPFTNYEVRLAMSQTAIATPNYMLTTTNSTPSNDQNDNDAAIVGSSAVISFTTEATGSINHTYDFGFKPFFVCVPPNAGNNMVACAGECKMLTGSNPNTGTWIAQSNNPNGAILGTTLLGVVQVCLDNTANGVYNFIYNVGSSCEDTMQIVVHLQASIGNYVWNDANGDGLQNEASTSGINGATVELWKETAPASGVYAFEATTMTANDGSSNPGYYQFHVCETANYKVKFPLENAGLPLTLTTTTAGTDGNNDADKATGFSPAFNIDVTATGIAKDNPTIDAGYYDHACLGDYVWNDIDKDGVQDANEVGVAGITVTLLDNTNNVLSSTITDAYGYYHFCPLDPATYKVGFTLPANYVFTNANTANDETDSDVDPNTGLTTSYLLAQGDTNYTVDAGIYFQQPISATVGNYVWLDVNQDGIQDGNEEGISGVTVTLCNTAGTVIATTITDADGFYLFTNVTPGTYSVGFTKPVGLLFSPNNGAVTNPSNSDANPTTGKTTTFTVNAGDEITTIDAGLYSQPILNGGLGDKVWYDTDQDGVQDNDETAVGGVTVNLCQADGVTLISTTTTDAFGNYVFNNLPQGQYTIGFLNLPGGYVFTTNTGTDSATNSNANPATGKTPIINLAQGQFNMTIDAGIYTTVPTNTNSLGNFVWYDVNKNGVQEPTELGVAGVTVKLYDNANIELKSTSTNGDGLYLFPDLPNGDYHVGFSNIPLGFIFSSENQGSDLLDSDPNVATGLTASVALIGNTHDRSLDAGINLGNTKIGKATLGDLVWYDIDNDGLQDADELGVPNVTVNLCGSDGVTILATTKTDALGNYIFTGLDAGTYGVAFSNLPAGFTVSPKNADAQGINGEANSDVNPATLKTDLITIGTGEDKMSVDMGITPPVGSASLGNLVWFDLNNDGLQTPAEPGVQGITVTLCDVAGQPLKTTTTNADGEYYFVGLTPDTYAVKFSNLPTGYSFATQNADGNGINGASNSDANATTGKTSSVTLVTGENNPRLDAGIVSTIVASVGDYVWFDENRDGIQDPTETPIGGVLVTLYNSTNTPVTSAITKPDGSYIFTNVTPDDYTIGFSNTPTGMEFTTQETIPTSNTGSNVNPATGITPSFTVLAGTHTPTIDAGLYVPLLAGLGNYVWIDANQNRLQDPEEIPVAGVLATLYSSSINGTIVLATAVTDGNGAYSFTNLEAGTYIVRFSNFPLNYIVTPSIGNINDPLNSDVDLNGSTNPVTLVAGEYNPNIDAGIYLNQGVPIVLGEFNVVDLGCRTNINWTTLQELNASHFDIERKSQNNGLFEKVAEVKATGNSQTLKAYSYTDLTMNEGLNEYRLKMVDIDEKFEYSITKNVNTVCAESEISLYPNPTSDMINLIIKSVEAETFTIKIIDMLGKVVYTNSYDVSHQTKVISVPVASFANGFYNIMVVNSVETKTLRFEKIRE